MSFVYRDLTDGIWEQCCSKCNIHFSIKPLFKGFGWMTEKWFTFLYILHKDTYFVTSNVFRRTLFTSHLNLDRSTQNETLYGHFKTIKQSQTSKSAEYRLGYSSTIHIRPHGITTMIKTVQYTRRKKLSTFIFLDKISPVCYIFFSLPAKIAPESTKPSSFAYHHAT